MWTHTWRQSRNAGGNLKSLLQLRLPRELPPKHWKIKQLRFESCQSPIKDRFINLSYCTKRCLSIHWIYAKVERSKNQVVVQSFTALHEISNVMLPFVSATKSNKISNISDGSMPRTGRVLTLLAILKTFQSWITGLLCRRLELNHRTKRNAFTKKHNQFEDLATRLRAWNAPTMYLKNHWIW